MTTGPYRQATEWARKHCSRLGAEPAPERPCCECMGFVGSTLCHVHGDHSQAESVQDYDSHEIVMVSGRGYCQDCHPGKGWQRHTDYALTPPSPNAGSVAGES